MQPRRNIFFYGSIASLLQLAPAYSADQPAIFKAPAAKAAPVVIPTWTGFYLGAHAGYGWAKKTWMEIPDGAIDADRRVGGALFGLQTGYNYQVSWLVLGAEADFSWAGVDGRYPCFSVGDQTCTSDSQWFGSVAGRLGIAVGPALLFAKGGAAWTRDKFTNIDAGDLYTGFQTRSGWILGAGVEYMFLPSWSVKVEYNHMDFGTKGVLLTADDGSSFPEEIHQKVDLIKVGVNYQFGWGAVAPASASTLGYASTSTSFDRRFHGVRASENEDDEAAGRVNVFSAIDVGPQSLMGWAGAVIALSKDLDTSGPRIMIMGEAGRYKYPTDEGSIRGTYSSGDALVGWGFEGDNYSISLLGGVNAANHMLSAPDPTNSVQGTAFGAAVRGEAWVNPTPATLTYGEAQYSTAFNTFYTEAKFGFDITQGKQVFVGPVVMWFGDERHDQWRVGAHATQLKFGKLQVDVSAGYAHDSDVGAGAFGRVALETNF